MTSFRAGRRVGAPVAVLAVLAIAAPAAMAKKAPLDGQLIGDASKRGSKVEAPVLLTGKSAKKLKLKSPIALLRLKGSKSVPVPNPAGAGQVSVAPDTLRAGDEIDGKGKRKGSPKKLMPVVKAGKIAVTGRESAYSVDELTQALIGLYQQVGALGLRVDALESALVGIRAELEELKQQNSGLAGQINTILTQLDSLTSQLGALTSLVDGLPTAAELQGILDDIADLQTQIDALDDLVNDPTSGLAALQTQLTTLQGQVGALIADVNVLCGLPIVGGVCP